MIAPYLLAALNAPLTIRPNYLEAEIRAIAERDRISPFAAALEQFGRANRVEPEFAL